MNDDPLDVRWAIHVITFVNLYFIAAPLSVLLAESVQLLQHLRVPHEGADSAFEGQGLGELVETIACRLSVWIGSHCDEQVRQDVDKENLVGEKRDDSRRLVFKQEGADIDQGNGCEGLDQDGSLSVLHERIVVLDHLGGDKGDRQVKEQIMAELGDPVCKLTLAMVLLVVLALRCAIAHSLNEDDRVEGNPRE